MIEKLFPESMAVTVGEVIKLIFFPGSDAPKRVRLAIAIYWVAILVVVIRVGFQIGVPPLNTFPEVEAALTVFALLGAGLFSFAYTVMQLSARKAWARNLLLVSTTLLVVTNLYQLFENGLSAGHGSLAGLTSIAVGTVAGLFLLTSRNWFKSKMA
ncbi:hypothetical protein [Burkholderia sp. Ax-1719]|uniref:hypothetical protein n=1 Tax=Burkholderia sp. Ax-1719 TaxID=2608334 RepID=UPI00141DF481|nr:hypothetical protein [Burkholderia sp. Ax-1719]NIE65378.1 hypothetical protein [Burkholderia sp. Ax-1719]